MGRIVRLSEDLSNQIAAGEVVERPASVVKELVENAVDARAGRIQVDVASGGVGLVRVTDDGEGMDEPDARLAVERHATSKISRIEDLGSLGTFGFRGEALPSIASVSRFALRTRRREGDAGVEVAIEGGGPMRVGPCGMAPGTSVEVRDLFFNVPARRKFLKALPAEAAAITAVVEALALAVPSLTVTLARDGREVRQYLRAASRAERVLDARPDDRLAPLQGSRGPLRLEAYLGPPELARTAMAGLAVLVNGRVVRDRVVARVIAQAYGSVLPAGRYPLGVVYLDIEPALVDVNVHPQKAEVRFADARAVHDALYRIVENGLGAAFGLASPSARAGAGPWQGADRTGAESRPEPSVWARRAPEASEPRAWGPPAAAGDRFRAQGRSSPVEDAGVAGPDPWGLAPPAPRSEPTGAQVALPLAPPPAPPPAPPISPHLAPRTSERYGSLRFLAQLRSTYLLCEGDDGLVVIDQHAAAERVAFARLRTGYEKRRVASQRLLVPVALPIDAREAALVEQMHDEVASVGLEIRLLGPGAAVVTAVPQVVSSAAPERLARDLLDELSREGGRGFSARVDRVLATMACHGALRAGESVSAEQAAALLEALDGVEHGGHCPHGRPLVHEVRFSELEREVGRR